MERRALVELPAIITVLAHGVDGQHGDHLAVTCDIAPTNG